MENKEFDGGEETIQDLKMNRDKLNEEIERAYDRLRKKDNEIRELKRQISKQYTINAQYREIVTCLEIIIDEMKI